MPGAALRAKQLWTEVRAAAGRGHLHVDHEEALEAGALVDLFVLSPPSFTLGRPLPLPRHRSSETCMERYLESASHSILTPGSVIQTVDAMHALLLNPVTLNFFSCAFWLSLLGNFRRLEDLPADYVSGLFLNSALFFTTLMRQQPVVSSSMVVSLDLVSGIAGAVLHAMKSLFPTNAADLASTSLLSCIEQNLVRWTIGLDGLEYHKRRERQQHKAHGGEDTVGFNHAAAPSQSAPEAPGSSAPAGLISERDQRLRRYQALIRMLPSDGTSSSNPVATTLLQQQLMASTSGGAGGDRRPPYVSRMVAMKRSGALTGEASEGNEGRVSIADIHRRCQLTTEARRVVLDREKEIAAGKKKEALAKAKEAEAFALAHMISAEQWLEPQRDFVRRFHLDAVSPLMQLFLVATSQRSIDVLDGASEGANMSVFQAVHSIPVSHISLSRLSTRSGSYLPVCPRCGDATLRVPAAAAASIPSGGHSSNQQKQPINCSPYTSPIVCGCCGNDANASSSSAKVYYLICLKCNGQPVCRSCAKRPKASTADVDRLKTIETDPTRLFGESLASHEWVCFDEERYDTTAIERDVTRRRRAIKEKTCETWARLVREYIAQELPSTAEERQFCLFLRSADVTIGEDGRCELKRSVDAAADNMQCLDGDDADSFAVVHHGGVHPSPLPVVASPPSLPNDDVADEQGVYAQPDGRVAGSRASRPPSAPVRRSAAATSFDGLEDATHRKLGTFLTGVAISHSPRDSLGGHALLSRPSSALSRPSSAVTRPTSALSRPSSALSRPSSAGLGRPASSSCSLTKTIRPSSAMSRTSLRSTSLSFACRAASPTIPWTIQQTNDDAALSRFIRDTKTAVRSTLDRVHAINTQQKMAETAHLAGTKAYKANISRFAVEHLQDLKRGEEAIRQSEKDTEELAMRAVTEAVEATSMKQHHPLKEMDMIKEALYQIDVHFESLPETYRQELLKYAGAQSATLASKIRTYKMTQRDRSQWPASLDDLRCSRAREAAKYGHNAVYMSPSKKPSWCRSDSGGAAALQSSVPDNDYEGVPNEMNSGSPTSYTTTQDSSPIDTSCKTFPESMLESSPCMSVEALLAAHEPSSKSPVTAASPTPVRDDGMLLPPSDAYPSSVPPPSVQSTPIGGPNSGLVSRAGIMLWTNSNEAVGKRAAEMRRQFVEKRNATENPFRLRIGLQL